MVVCCLQQQKLKKGQLSTLPVVKNLTSLSDPGFIDRESLPVSTSDTNHAFREVEASGLKERNCEGLEDVDTTFMLNLTKLRLY